MAVNKEVSITLIVYTREKSRCQHWSKIQLRESLKYWVSHEIEIRHRNGATAYSGRLTLVKVTATSLFQWTRL